MIIDLTEIHEVIHHLWDVVGVLLAVGFGLSIPVAVVAASIIKIEEHKKSKLENKDN